MLIPGVLLTYLYLWRANPRDGSLVDVDGTKCRARLRKKRQFFLVFLLTCVIAEPVPLVGALNPHKASFSCLASCPLKFHLLI